MGVTPRKGLHSEPQPYRATIIALLLIAFAISGFGAGLVTRTVAGDVLTPIGSSAPTSTTQGRAPAATSTHAPSTPTTTPTVIPTAVAQSGFTLHASVSTKNVAPGQQFTVVATALASDNITPVAGLACYMRARTDGTPPLFQQWPGPQITDTDGHATWTLTAPQNTPGTYGFEVVAYGAHSWSYRYDVSVTITAANG